MDIFFFIFVVMGFGSVITGFILEGGHIVGLWAPTAAIIILGGTIGATGVSFPKSELMQFPKMFKVLIRDQKYDYRTLMERMKAMCVQVRQSGLLSLESQIDQEPDSLMRKGMRLIVDGTSPSYTREALELSLQVIDERIEVGDAERRQLRAGRRAHVAAAGCDEVVGHHVVERVLVERLAGWQTQRGDSRALVEDAAKL
jgi:chemotaxis protein MotA